MGHLQFARSMGGVSSSFSHSTTSPGGAGICEDARLMPEGQIRAQTFGTTIFAGDLTTGHLNGAAIDAMPGRAAFCFDRQIEVVFTGSIVGLLGAIDQVR